MGNRSRQRRTMAAVRPVGTSAHMYGSRRSTSSETTFKLELLLSRQHGQLRRNLASYLCLALHRTSSSTDHASRRSAPLAVALTTMEGRSPIPVCPNRWRLCMWPRRTCRMCATAVHDARKSRRHTGLMRTVSRADFRCGMPATRQPGGGRRRCR